jgi:beta-glucosidase/6-phospho-beta-glucosidase/beta-galactosidase
MADQTTSREFRPGFNRGVAASPHQIEGAWDEAEKGPQSGTTT